MRKLRILITDAQELAGLGAVRSLGRAGHIVTAGHPEGVLAPSAHSKWCHAEVSYPDPWRTHMQFRSWLQKELESGKYDAVLPVAEAAIVAVQSLRSSLPKNILAILPSDQHLTFTLSKYHSNKAAIDAGLTVAKTVFVSDGQSQNWNVDLSTLQFPLIIKSDNVLLSDGSYVKGTSTVVRNLDEATKVFSKLRPLGCAVIAQEFIDGKGVGTSILRHRGKTELAFCHERMHEVPWTGGASSLRKSSDDEHVLAAAEKFLDAINYEGVAMVEFRREADGSLSFMEINGRLWGSIALSQHAGFDFAAALVDCMADDSASESRKAPSFKKVTCRNVYPADLWYIMSVFEVKKDALGRRGPSKVLSLVKFFALFFDPRIKYDVFWLSDPIPAFHQARILFVDLKGGLKYRLSLLKAPLRKKRSMQNAVTSMPKHILFVCYGNICRSAFADHAWKKLRETHPSLPTSSGSGFNTIPNRTTPEEHLPIAEKLGVNLSMHRSTTISKTMVDAAGAIFLMDSDNFSSMMKEFPSAKEKTFFLGSFSGDSDKEIEDPYGLPIPRAAKDYEKIARSIEGLKKHFLGLGQ